MQLSAAGLALLKASEGFSAAEYIDAAGKRTIGYGHKLTGFEYYIGGISEAQAALHLAQDVAVAAGVVSRLVRAPLTQGQFDALVDFTFNLGGARLQNSTLLTDLNAQQFDAAALQLLRWDHAGAKELTALKTRRAAEYTLWTGHAVPEKRMLSNIADNVWAFALFVIGAGLALTAAHWGNKDLMTFAGTVAMTGAALFHGKSDKPAA